MLPEDPIAGIRIIKGRVEQFECKEYFRNMTIDEHLCRRDVIIKQRKVLNQEVDQIEKKIEETKKEMEERRALASRNPPIQSGPSPPKTPSSTREEETSSFISSGSPTETQTKDQPPPRSPTPIQSSRKSRSRPRSQYKRFFKELAERERIVDRETYDAHEALTSEFNDIAEELHLLRHCRDEKQHALVAARDALEAAYFEEGDQQHHFGNLFAPPHEDAKEIKGGVGIKS
jgi:DNA repair exonuclease SbcCD ATPase subunit